MPSSTAIRGAVPNQTVEGIDAQLDLAGKISGVITGYPVGTQGTIAISAERLVEGEWWAMGFAAVEPYTSPPQFEIGSLPAGGRLPRLLHLAGLRVLPRVCERVRRR